MKKTMIFAAFAALVSLASCQKEDNIINGTDNQTSPVFTASIAGATRTTVNLTDGKVAWEETDEITVTDASSASAVYEIESIDETTGKATFVIKDGETALGDGPYTATYGTAPATAQTYSATAGKLYMTAPETSNNSFEFTVQCGLMKLNLTKTGESVKSIAVTGTPTGGSETTYTLTCDPAESIATAKDFCIALPEGSYTKIEITNAEDITCTLNSAAGVAVVTNHIKPVTFGGSKLNFAPAAPEPLAGVFSVSDTKKVQFSKGNLWADASNALHFEANQYGCNSSYESSHLSFFSWSSTIAAAVTITNSGDYLFCNDSHKVSVDGSDAIYYALSNDEWNYLYGHHEHKKVSVNGMNGFVIAPDGFTGTLSDSYDDDAALAAENLIFIPLAGRYTTSKGVENFGTSGYYWVPQYESETRACCIQFLSSNDLDAYSGGSPSSGRSIRLVTDYTAPTTGTAKATIGGNSVDVKWIQLWKDGPKFAEYNVGATSATEYGGYYTWGGSTKNGQGIEWTADQNTGSAQLLGDTDTATKLWGSNWRMPTNDELGKYEGEDLFMDPLCGGLLYECTCTWVKNYNGTGVNGLLCTGKGDYSSNSIFLPGAGYLEISGGLGGVWDKGGQCDYWTSMPDYGNYAYYMSISSDDEMYVCGDGCRWQGYSVRAVLAE